MSHNPFSTEPPVSSHSCSITHFHLLSSNLWANTLEAYEALIPKGHLTGLSIEYPRLQLVIL